jgi:hypothetical protein
MHAPVGSVRGCAALGAPADVAVVVCEPCYEVAYEGAVGCRVHVTEVVAGVWHADHKDLVLADHHANALQVYDQHLLANIHGGRIRRGYLQRCSAFNKPRRVRPVTQTVSVEQEWYLRLTIRSSIPLGRGCAGRGMARSAPLPTSSCQPRYEGRCTPVTYEARVHPLVPKRLFTTVIYSTISGPQCVL